MSNIYKLYHNTGKIEKIYIFVGDFLYNLNMELIELDNIYKLDKNSNTIKEIFYPRELDKIEKNMIEIVFIDDTIYADDTIENIKFKLLKNIDNYSFEELYLYGFTNYKIDKDILYSRLTNNNKIQLDKIILSNFLNNIGKPELIDKLPEKEFYDLDDIDNISLEQDNIIKVALGQKFVINNSEITHVIDPFNIIKIDPFLEKNAQDVISTSNKNLLFEYGVKNNIIYFTLLEDIIQLVTDDITINSLIKIYFPFIYNNEIEDYETFLLSKSKYVSRTEKILKSSSFNQYNSSISLFNKLSLDESRIKYLEIGLKSIELNIYPDNQFNFPIDIIFKLINSTIDKPLIKYNPGKGQENIYRLFCDKRSKNGKKIPFLKKTLVLQLMKSIGFKKSVSIYSVSKDKISMLIEFNNNGVINVKILSSRVLDLNYIQERISNTLNPILKNLQDKLENTGYKFNYFTSILDKNIEINNIQYYSAIEIDKNINLSQIKSCISSIFNIKTYNLTNGISMRYKRVSNYNEMNSIDTTILELLKLQFKEVDILKNIIDNYNLTEEVAREKIASVINNLQLVKNLYRGMRIKIKDNPGFLTTIDKDKFKNRIYINVENIDNLEYIDNITKFINSIIKITQKINLTEKDNAIISKLCKNKTVKDEKYIDDIIAQNEREYAENMDVNIDGQADEIVFDSDTKDDDDDDDIIGDDKELMDFFLGESDDDDDNDDNDDNDGDNNDNDSDNDDATETQLAGVLDDDLKDITGKNIANPSPFFKKLREYEPTLFLTENDSKFHAYSRTCPSNLKRQPVLLTDLEKEKIDREHPGSYTKAIKYGSSPDKQYWYICPRYWSLRDNVSLTQEQVDSGEYGNIIPQDAKTVPPGGNIYEFNSTYHNDSSGKGYKNMYPGYMQPNKHPDDKCIPCCFKTWDTPSQLKRRKQCEQEQEQEGEQKGEQEGEEETDGQQKEEGEQRKQTEQNEEENTDSKSKRIDEYIKGPEKFPLEKDKWGYIPLSLQYLLNFDSRKCYVSKLNTNLKPFVPCLLRRGVVQDTKNSFVSVIANIFKEKMSSQELIELIVSSLTIDNFVRYNNGNLVQLFRDRVTDIENLDNIDITKYSESRIYNNIDISNPKHNNYLKMAITSYGNFISFLNDKNSIIDHTYLWDIITSPNKNLFIQGVNLIIFELDQTDITDNVSIICPTNNYSDKFFDPDKKTILLIKQDKYYEPIYAVEDTKLKFNVTKLFNLKNKEFLPELKSILTTISVSLVDKCRPKPSINVVNLNRNLHLDKIINIIFGLKYEIDYQVVDYRNKVIGIYISREDVFGYLPTYPSNINMDYDIPIKFMDDVEWNDYNTTKTLLETVYVESREKIACLPKIKIMEDKMIVGILTNGNQFVKLDKPEVNTYDDELLIQNERDYILTDNLIQEYGYKEHDKKLDTIRNVELEESFYKMFRNILRKNISTREFRREKTMIVEILDDKSLLYIDKLERIDKIIREIMDISIIFSEMSDSTLKHIKDLVSCNESGEECKDLNYCMVSSGKNCMQVLPIKNLINGLDNRELYFAKVADELIRYKKLKQFIMDSDKYLSISKIDYNINHDEIIIIQSLLNAKFFEDLQPITQNSFVNYLIYDNVNPDKTKKYSNEVKLDEIKKVDYGDETVEDIVEISDSGCSLTKKLLIGYLQEQFPPKTYEIYYKTPKSICSYEIILNILKDNLKEYERLSIFDLKKQMVEIYKYYQEDIKLLIILLIELNKKVILEKVLDKVITMDEILLSEEYYLTYIDMILIAKYYNLPIVLISSMPIIEKILPDTILIPNKIQTKEWYFIKLPSIVTRVKRNDYPIYKLLTYNSRLKIDIDVVSASLKANIDNELENERDILTILFDNVKPKKKYKLKLIDNVKPLKQKLKIVQ